MTSFAQDLVRIDGEHLDLRAGLLGFAVLALFGVAIALALSGRRRAALGRGHFVLEPRSAGDFHLRPEAEPGRPAELLHPPEVERVADPEMDWVAASEAHPDAADQAIHESPNRPEYVRIRPARIAAETLDFGEDSLRRRGDDPPTTLDDHPLAGGDRRQARPIRPR